jgi:uncharacterized metal-binding protein YceD (DUF177 family)
MSKAPILSHAVEVVRIPQSGMAEGVEASEPQRRALASEYGLVEVKSLSGDVSLTRGHGDSLKVDGRILADIVQSCVVSLEPVPQHIDERFAVSFVPPGSPKAPPAPRPGVEVAIDADAEDPPEILTGSTLDIGALVEEHFVLAIDPYPRAADAVVPPEGVDEPAAGEDSPFAVLAGMGKPVDEG